MSNNAEAVVQGQVVEETPTSNGAAQGEVVEEKTDALDNAALEDELFGDCDEDAPPTTADSVGEDRLAAEIASYLHEGCDLQTLSMKKVFEELGHRLKLNVETFSDDFKGKVKALVTQRVEVLTSTPEADEKAENDEGENQKKRRRAKGDKADGDTPVKQSKKSRRTGDKKRDPVGEPLSIDVAGTKILAQPRETPSGKLGYYGTGIVIAEVDGKKVELQCMFQCAVISSLEEEPAVAPEEPAAA